MLNDAERKPGRPTLEPGKKSATVRVTLPPSLYDRYCRSSIRRDIPVAELHRRALLKFDPDEDDD